MARNQEKAQSMLNRWVAYKREERLGHIVGKKKMGKRPTLASEVGTIGECEKWRMQLVREIGRKVMEVQNESLGEQRIRDLNDTINKLLREKGHWERRIIELGGPNYRKYERIADDEFIKAQVPTPSGEGRGFTYKYFGAARQLPGVKELFYKPDDKKRKRLDFKGIDAAYYGYRDDDDTVLEQLELEAEKRAIAEAVGRWEQEHDSAVARKKASTSSASINDQELRSIEETEEEAPLGPIVLPTNAQIEARMVELKKEELIRKYAQM